MNPKVSLVIPAYNEADNLQHLVPEAIEHLTRAGISHEIVVIDDGSTDGTPEVLEKLSSTDSVVRGASLRRNSGKSTALQFGIDIASGDIIVLLDADGQDDPSEIPRLLQVVQQDADLVTGRRSERKDRQVKKLTSRLYNFATARITGVSGRDFNSGLKVMRKEVADSLALYGELHRYIPVLAHWLGFRVVELDVSHRPRLHGVSKFGKARFWRGFLDLVTVKFLTTYTWRPLHLFGGIGALLGTAGGLLLVWMLALKFAGVAIGNRPALLAGILLSVVAVQMISLGLLAELFIHLRGPTDANHLIRDVYEP